MKLKFFLIPLMMMCSSPFVYADDGLDITYKLPIVPLEISFDSDGISFHASKTIVTPLGSFSLGYTKYEADLDDDYTYVIIEDMNLKKEHIYKVNDKKKLKLLTEGRTEITITKNRVRILVEKGSRFTVKFSVEGEEESEQSSSLSSKWITPTNSTCKRNGGEINNGFCEAPWEDAKKICSASGGELPTFDELKKVVTDCGGKIDDSDNNRENNYYQDCYERKGFNSNLYWSSTSVSIYSSLVWIVYFNDGYVDGNDESNNGYVRCVRAGQ